MSAAISRDAEKAAKTHAGDRPVPAPIGAARIAGR
jgi:hypothetical protein